MTAAAPRFTVHDSLAGQSLSLIPRGDRRRRERYWVMDGDAKSDPVYDVLSTKATAIAEARDLNAGLYGPLAVEEAS